jgi:hypothetical protein
MYVPFIITCGEGGGGGGGGVRYNCVILKEGRTKLFIVLKFNFSFLPGPPCN